MVIEEFLYQARVSSYFVPDGKRPPRSFGGLRQTFDNGLRAPADRGRWTPFYTITFVREVPSDSGRSRYVELPDAGGSYGGGVSPLSAEYSTIKEVGYLIRHLSRFSSYEEWKVAQDPQENDEKYYAWEREREAKWREFLGEHWFRVLLEEVNLDPSREESVRVFYADDDSP